MTNLNKVVTQGVGTTLDASQYVGASGEITVDAVAARAAIHDGITPGGLALGGYSIVGPITAGSGENPNGPVLTANAYNVVATVNNSYDSVTLPPAIAGTAVIVMVPPNQSSILSIWANGSDTINGIVNDPVDYSGLSQQGDEAAGLATFLCVANGAWYANCVPD
jgi:hypothetical protein